MPFLHALNLHKVAPEDSYDKNQKTPSNKPDTRRPPTSHPTPLDWFFAVDLGTNDGTRNRLYLEFVRDADESRFETEEVPIACLITSANVCCTDSDAPDRPAERSIAAKSCRVVDPDANLLTDLP